MSDEFRTEGGPSGCPAPGSSGWFDELAESLRDVDRFSAARLWSGTTYPRRSAAEDGQIETSAQAMARRSGHPAGRRRALPFVPLPRDPLGESRRR